MAKDPVGNIYLTGSTASATFPTTPGVVQPTFGGGMCLVIGPIGGGGLYPCEDAFVIKLDPTGKVIYATYLGGNYEDSGYAIAADAAGNAYVAGITGSANFPTTPSSAFPTYTQEGSFIAKLNPQGTALIYSTLMPNVGENAASISVDGTGAVYFAGTVNSNNAPRPFPTTPGAYQTQLPSGSSIPLVAKLNPAGSAFVYSTYVGGTASNTQAQTSGIAIDSSGNAYITGNTYVRFVTTPGAFQTSEPDQEFAAFAAKLNADGSQLDYATFLGGKLADEASTIRVDSQGNATVLGTAYSNNFPVTAGALQPTGPAAAWGADPNTGNFLSKFNAQGTTLVYSSYLTGATAMDLDAVGNIYVAGTAGYGFPTTPGAYQGCVGAGDSNIFVAEFDPNGNLLGATYVGGDAAGTAQGIVALGNGSVYLLGTGPSGQFVAKLLIDDPQKPPAPCISGFVQNAASFQSGAVAAGEMVTLSGYRMAPDKGLVVSASGGIPNQLAGVQVLFDSVPAPLLYVQAQQINAVVPWEVAGQPQTQVQVQYGGASSNVATIPVTPSQPALFHSNYSSTQGAILNGDGSFNSTANPAARGSIVALWGTGGGPMSPAGIDGALWPANPLAMLQLPVTATIGGVSANVVYAGAAPGLVSGFFQINLQIPPSAPTGPVVVQISIGGVPIPNGRTTFTTIAVN